jgi:hypothetical protein
MKIGKLRTTVFSEHLRCGAMPDDYDAVLKSLGKQGDFNDVLKINIPRNDVKETI